MEFVAPAGTAIRIRDIAAWIGRIRHGQRNCDELTTAFRQHFGVGSAHAISSGRAGMSVLLTELAAMAGADRHEVIVPAYTCYSVPASAVKAGLKVRVVDIDPATLSYDLAALRGQDFGNVLAIVTANLYGVPNELTAIEAIAREHGVYLVDDAAQAMGATSDGRCVGSFGTAGLFSLDKGKNITSIQGGVLVSNDPTLTGRLEQTLATLPAPDMGTVASYSLQLLAYALLLNPRLYWLPERVLDLGGTIYTTEWPTTGYSPVLAAMTLGLFHRLYEINGKRRTIAQRLTGICESYDGVTFPAPAGAEPVYARFPILLPDRRTRDRLMAELRGLGIGASESYPRAIADVPELGDWLVGGAETPGGRAVAERVLTLPTHGHVRERHLARIERGLRAVL